MSWNAEVINLRDKQYKEGGRCFRVVKDRMERHSKFWQILRLQRRVNTSKDKKNPRWRWEPAVGKAGRRTVSITTIPITPRRGT